MNNSQKQRARAEWIQQIHDRREQKFAAERAAEPGVSDELREARSEDRFREAFKDPKGHSYTPRDAQPRANTWDTALGLGRDDDTPGEPQADPEPVAAPALMPAMETRARQEAMTAEALFQQMESRMQATPEVVSVSPEVTLRRAFRELPGAQREALAAKVEAEDFGLSGYFAARNFSDDYRAVLVGHSLAKRYADAVRLQPDLSPDALLQQMLGTAT